MSSNHLALKISTRAVMVSKLFSMNVAAPMAMEKRSKRIAIALVEIRNFKNFTY